MKAVIDKKRGRPAEASRARAQRRAALNLLEDAVLARQAMEKLGAEAAERERRFRELIDALPAAVYTTDAAGRLTHFNPACIEFAGRTPRIDEDRWCVTWKMFHPDGQRMLHEAGPMAIALRESRAIQGVEIIAERPDGTRLWFEPYPTPLKDATGTVVGGVNLLMDISERKHRESLLQCQKEALEMIARDVPLAEILDHVALKVESHTQGFMLVAIHLLNENHSAVASVVAPSLPSLYCEMTHGLPIDSPSAPWCEVVATAEPLTVDDFTQDHRWPRFAEFAHACGIRSGSFVPLVSSSGQVVGTIAGYYRKPRQPSARDHQFLSSVPGTVVLVLERERAERARRESEQRARFLAQAITSIVWSTDARGHFVDNQEAWSAYTGQTWEEMCGLGWTAAIHPDDRERVQRLWGAAVESRQEYFGDGRLWHAPSRTYRRFEGRGVPVARGDGSIREWVGSCTDVEDRERAQEALRESDAKYRVIFNGAAVSLWEEDFSAVKAAVDALQRDGVSDLRAYCEQHPEFVLEALSRIRVVDVNDATVKMFEARDKNDLVGALPNIYPRESFPVVVEVLVALAEGRTFMQAEALLHTMRGTAINVVFTMTPASADRVLFSVLDVTERSRWQQQTEQLAEQLADQHRRKDEFLAMLSHELRNPLAPIANAVQLLQLERMTESPGTQQARSIIERQVAQLSRLVDDLLEVSRITSGKVQLRREVVLVAGLVERAAESAAALIERRGHVLSLCVPSEPMWLDVDAARMEQVLVNLLSNAAKYTDQGGEISVIVERVAGEAGAAGTVLLRVRDNGIGIAPDLLPRIFDMFTQADRELDRSQGGLGIGLALAHRLVDLHGGTIEARSVVGRGSEFIVRMPEHVLRVAATEPSRLSERSEPPRAGHRVLVVEDNADTAESMALLLRAHGNDVRVVADGLSAVAEARAFAPQLVLLDIGLPGLDGFETAKLMRREEDLAGVVLVALTGYGRDSDRQRAREAGFDHHLVKPADFAKIRAVLAQLDSPPN